MAVCDWCDREMTTAASCSVGALHLNGKPVPLVAHGAEARWGRGARPRRCGDCGVLHGGFHHLGCDVQECPLCRGQMFTCGCRFDEDGSEDAGDDDLVDRYFDGNGVPTERRRLGGLEVIIHYDDIPETDITTVHGIRCTTALRTVIDIAPDVEPEHLQRIVKDALGRQLFTVDEAWARLADDDMRTRRGAELLRQALQHLE